MKTMFLLAAAAGALMTVPATAAMYQLHYTGTNDTTTADLRITTASHLNGLGGYSITAVTGNVDGDVITGVAPINPPGFNTDNTYYAADPIFSNPGLGMLSATTTYNIWGNSPGSYTLYGTTNGGGSYAPQSVGTLSITAVPEPAMWGLMIAGFAMTGFAARRRVALAV